MHRQDRQGKQRDRQVPGESVNDDGWNMLVWAEKQMNEHMEIDTSVLVLRTVTTEHQQSSVTTDGGRFFFSWRDVSMCSDVSMCNGSGLPKEY